MLSARSKALRPPTPPARRNGRVAPALELFLAVALLAMGSPADHAAQTSGVASGRAHTVIIEDMRFNPQTLRVHRGDRITWVNQDPFPHTVTATSGKFDSHLIAPGGSWTHVARKAGEYDYVCTLHVTMKGRLEVR